MQLLTKIISVVCGITEGGIAYRSAYVGGYMKNIFKRIVKKEDGVLIVEASYVFPIVVIVIFMLIFAGNAYLLKAQVESIVVQEMLKGAAYCGDPYTYYLEESNGTVPEYSDADADILPYRFLIGGMENFERIISANIDEQIENVGSGLFSNMEIQNVNLGDVTFNNMFICSTFSTEVTYEIELPIRIWDEDFIVLEFSNVVDVPVQDSVELIRNIDMVQDYMERSKLVQEGLDKINELVEEVKIWK